MENFPNMCLTCAIFSSETSRATQTFSFSDRINERNTLLLSRCLDWSHNATFPHQRVGAQRSNVGSCTRGSATSRAPISPTEFERKTYERHAVTQNNLNIHRNLND